MASAIFLFCSADFGARLFPLLFVPPLLKSPFWQSMQLNSATHGGKPPAPSASHVAFPNPAERLFEFSSFIKQNKKSLQAFPDFKRKQEQGCGIAISGKREAQHFLALAQISKSPKPFSSWSSK
ncbi:ribosomal RNA large subunit methyltransferase G [Striga asiatica]|uniref:Ribosomal RNA large subunit methyltransferase G n=1 Tax=Striga asiatica TaxID=4170 RepID=A0A5A7P6K2_STRAF|nr:ribosomal RNA large subunit methyltransferase G [Striga asiatica]